MKSNKGFTLIELLAVIVILAIIALIATPIILDVIETARKGSAESSALGYIDAVEKQIMIAQVTPDEDDNIATGATYTVSDLTAKNVSVKGQGPKSGWVKVDATGAAATGTCLVISLNNNDYNVAYTVENGKVKAEVQTDNCTAPSAG